MQKKNKINCVPYIHVLKNQDNTRFKGKYNLKKTIFTSTHIYGMHFQFIRHSYNILYNYIIWYGLGNVWDSPALGRTYFMLLYFYICPVQLLVMYFS